MLKKCVVCVIAVLAALTVRAAAGDEIRFIMTNQAPPEDVQHHSFVYLKDILEERSGGRIKVTYFNNSTMGSSNQEQTEMAMSGAVHFTTCPGFTFISLDASLKGFNISDFPFLFRTNEETLQFFDSELIDNLRHMAEERLETIKIYPAFIMGWHNLYSSKGPFRVPADIRGQKIRVSVNDLYVRVMEAWGCSATPINWTEVYTSLQQKVCDGLSTPTLLFYYQKFFEVQKYMCFINYVPFSHYPVLNKRWYDRLPDDLKEIFDGCMADYMVKTRELHLHAEKEAFDKIRDAGVEISIPTEEELALWRDVVVPLWESKADYCGPEIMKATREMLNR
ncbi:MAG: TRAP transporter substrate-binding protein [Planctomycetaceae bacterium]|nr:TRAP transporter substrate-binding protein [Planctomycetaceae bacterium]